ncbi:helicase-related protein, partial [Nitrospirota bacterium]
WLGGSVTPNYRQDAKISLRDITRDRNAENKFVLDKCPWCGGQLGPVAWPKGTPKQFRIPIGYKSKNKTVVFECYDAKCPFSKGIPIYVIDEDIYEARPSLIIGTVDKFAMLAWKPEARSLFGINDAGSRDVTPPSLIIQDELHLISGPLGSMVGLYETVIEELCTDRREGKEIKPKIICSTATIRKYKEQVKALYCRTKVSLFPPPGISVDDSFFSKYAKDGNGHNLPGRMYVGIYAPGLGSLQTTQVRTFTSLLQAPMKLDEDYQDPWWTLIAFFNSLRELGTTLSLLQSDIPDRFKVIKNRFGLDHSGIRKLYDIRELTSRLRSDEIPKSISNLEVQKTKGNYPVDICLTSSIMEVGIDIDRLSLMVVVGQPKSTSQYIQVTGRVGRKWNERPGLVATIYTASKPRDRSHFEKFRSYHDKLYAEVEPTSVTPFSPPALDRALHAVLIAYIRQFASIDAIKTPYPIPEEFINKFMCLMKSRLAIIAPEELPNLARIFDKRIDEWKRWKRLRWQGDIGEDAPLMVRAGEYIQPGFKDVVWETPMSVRSVDSECQVQITNLYSKEEVNGSAEGTD